MLLANMAPPPGQIVIQNPSLISSRSQSSLPCEEGFESGPVNKVRWIAIHSSAPLHTNKGKPRINSANGQFAKKVSLLPHESQIQHRQLPTYCNVSAVKGNASMSPARRITSRNESASATNINEAKSATNLTVLLVSEK